MGYSLYAANHNCFSSNDGELPENVVTFLHEQGFHISRGTSEMKNNEALDAYYYLTYAEPRDGELNELNKIIKLIEGKFNINCEIYENMSLICGDVEG